MKILTTTLMISRNIFILLALSTLFTSCCLFPPTEPMVRVNNSEYSGEQLGRYIANEVYSALLRAPEFLFSSAPERLFFQEFENKNTLQKEINKELNNLLKRGSSTILVPSKKRARYILKAEKVTTKDTIIVSLGLYKKSEKIWSFNREFKGAR